MQAITATPAQTNPPVAGGAPPQAGTGAEGFFGAILAQLQGMGGEGIPGWMQPTEGFPLWGEQPDGEAAQGEIGQSDDPQAQLLAMQLLAQGMLGLPQNLMPEAQPQAALLAVQSAVTRTNTSKTPAQMPFAEPEKAQQGEKTGEFQALFETLSAAWGKEQSTQGSGDMTEAMRFQNALREVRQALSEKSKGNTDSEQPDIEALQGAVDDRRFLTQVETSKSAASAPSFEEIAKQVKAGILQNVKQGKSEFVIRLKPEGLGEITIRLSEEKDKISLSIVTSSAAVGKLISNEVTALQNALRPLHAEVKEITVIPAPAAQSNAAQTSMANDPGNGRQFAGRNQEDHTGRWTPQGEERFDNTVEEVLTQSGINILV